MWTIYKDIDTDTRRVYIYVESKYYCPSFEQFVFEKYYLNSILYSYALPVYSFADLADYVLWNPEYDDMNSESDFFQLLGVNKYDFYKAMGKVLVEQLKKKEPLYVKSGKIEINGQEIEQYIIRDIGDENGYKYVKYGSELTYENLLATYNKLYGDKINLTIPKEEESKTYKIELPNGEIEEINGKDLYKAKFRYSTTKNGDLQIKIENDSTQAETINYTGVTNIKECIYEEGEYVYTYNCLPYLDMGSKYEMNAELHDRNNRILECRFNLGGWNVVGKGLSANWGNEEVEGFQYNTQVKSSINGKPVTAMLATYEYQSEEVMMDTLNIPNTVKYMFDVCRHSKYNNITQIVLPSSVEYTSYCFENGKITIKGGENVKSWGLDYWNLRHNTKLE